MPAQRWEYTMTYVPGDFQPAPATLENLNALGLKGWEMVAVDDRRAWFKRPLED
jgi:hypothetical protein